MKNLKFFRESFGFTQKDLSKYLSLNENTIQFYELGYSFPSFKSLNKIINFFQISFDYFLLYKDCSYPKYLKLLKLAKILDEFSKSESRNNIEATTKNLLGDKINQEIKIKRDTIDIELGNNFNLNLKNIRTSKKITQNELADKINVSRSVLASYELKNHPPIDKLIKLSNILNISIHAFSTGEKLIFDFQDRHFGKTILLADQLLSYEHIKFLIELMENIVKKTEPQPASS